MCARCDEASGRGGGTDCPRPVARLWWRRCRPRARCRLPGAGGSSSVVALGRRASPSGALASALALLVSAGVGVSRRLASRAGGRALACGSMQSPSRRSNASQGSAQARGRIIWDCSYIDREPWRATGIQRVVRELGEALVVEGRRRGRDVVVGSLARPLARRSGSLPASLARRTSRSACPGGRSS